MNRRKFLSAAVISGGTLAGLPLVAEDQASNKAKVKSRETIGSSSSSDVTSKPYYEFSPDGMECLIKRYDLPVAWMNLLANDRLTAWVTHDGHILESCLINNQNNRLTNPSSGYVYIKDTDTQKYFMLNRPYPGGRWRSVQGLGYTVVDVSALGLDAQVTYFVPRDDDVLIWLTSIHNASRRRRNLQLYSLVEWCLGDVNYSGVLPGGDFSLIFNNSKRVDFEDNTLFGSNHCWGTLGQFEGQKVWPYTGFLTTNIPVESFECHKGLFLGQGNLENPGAVAKGHCTSKGAFGFTDFPVGALQNSVHLAPNEKKQIVILLGIVRDRSDAGRLRAKYVDPVSAEKALAGVKHFWNDFTSKIVVETPDKDIDRLVNIWNKYQYRASMLRNLNTGRLGFGIWTPAYPYGQARRSDIRETGNVTCNLELIKEDILDFLHGGPLLLESDLRLRWKPRECKLPPLPFPRDSRHYWPYPVFWYVQETGDVSFFDTKVEFNGTHPWMPSSGSGTIFELMKRSIAWSTSGLSKRGLPRMNPGYGDWNDGISLISHDGRAESVLSAVVLCYMLKECHKAAVAYGKTKEAAEWMDQYQHIKSAVNWYAWDGEWYIRAFDDEGTPMGSSENKEGKIYLTVQAYAVLSGVAEGERAVQCLQSADKHLMTPYGPNLLAPPYSSPEYNIGIASDFAPGWRENAGLWYRPCGWAIMANCVANRANEAFDMYEKACLTNFAKDLDQTRGSPYAYPESHVGAGQDFARAGFEWCMGNAGTMWRAYVYYILGVQPTLKGLRVDPKIPNRWKGFKLTRPFRGARYTIHVSNPRNVNRGVRSILVDGKTIQGNIIPVQEEGSTCNVHVALGT